MNILLINCPIRIDAEPNVISYGLATVASTLLNEGYDVEVYDINALRPKEDKIIKDLRGYSWDIVGVSGLITTYSFQKWLIPTLRVINPKGIIVSGGGLAASIPDLLFNKIMDLDIAVLGEGERTMLELVRVVEGGCGLRDVEGIWYRESAKCKVQSAKCKVQGTKLKSSEVRGQKVGAIHELPVQSSKIIKNRPRENIGDLDSIPFPAWDLLTMDIYLKNPVWGQGAGNSSGFPEDIEVKRSMSVISTRGCPHRCKYCYHLFGRGKYRCRSASNVVDEIEILIDRYGVDFIGFVDDNFLASKGRVKEFCRLVKDRGIRINWGCHGRVNHASMDVLKEIRSAGCVWIGYGIESGSQKILDLMEKGTTVERAKKAIVDTRKAGIYPNTTFMFGYPGETRETIRETVRFKMELGLDCGSFFTTPYPGTPLYREVMGKICDEDTFIESLGNATDFCINLTDFRDDELLTLKNLADRRLIDQI